VKTWPEIPARADVEAVVRDYFDLLRAGQVDAAAHLVDHTPVPHVLRSLWKGSVGTTVDEELGDALPADAWSTDRSWLGGLVLGDFSWGDSNHFYVEIIYRGQESELLLGFWVKPADDGWAVSGPSTLW
jgi:hypothetical protein